jgi:hypothetical protein
MNGALRYSATAIEGSNSDFYEWFSHAPSTYGGIVLVPCLDPVTRCGSRQMLLLPERCLGLQIIHDKGCSRESIAAVLAGGDNKDDGLTWKNQTIAVNGKGSLDRPARCRIQNSAIDFGFRHAWVMLNFKRLELAPFVAAKPGEGHERANPAQRLRERGSLGRGVKTFLLDAHDNPCTHSLIPRSSAEKSNLPPALISKGKAVRIAQLFQSEWYHGGYSPNQANRRGVRLAKQGVHDAE